MKMDTEEKTYFELKQLFEKNHESLLKELREFACNTEISKRKEFENNLLRLAQEITDVNMRNAVYEVLVSLQSIWNKYQPAQKLQEKFRAAFKGGNYKEAQEYYKKLAKQGLDYIGTFQKGEGEIIPISTDEKDMLLQYNKKGLTFYTLQFEQLMQLPMPESLSIINVHVPLTNQSTECMEMEVGKTDKTPRPIRKMWLLLEDKNGEKAIASIDMESIELITKQFHGLGQGATCLDEKLKDIYRLSCFQNHLLLVSEKVIYYRKGNGEWAEWYTTENKITTIEPTYEGCWIGHSNGYVLILKSLQYVGNRAVFKGFSDTIKCIWGAGKHVLISSKNCLRIADYGGKLLLEPFETRCEIIQTTILNDEFFLMLQGNGMLIARELAQGNISWQMNLGNSYEMHFTSRQYVYCGKRDGETMMFEIPSFHTMAKELESKNIIVEKLSLEMEPTAPVRHISDFTGRRDILNEIKETGSAHFLLYGEARVGKTSLLNALRDTLSEKARCCIIDMDQLLKDVTSYKKFELKFMEKCLQQHFMKPSEIHEKDGCDYQGLRSRANKIKGTREFCVFGMDNFFIPRHFAQNDLETFKTFLRSMFLIPEARLIITYGPGDKDDIKTFLDDFKDIFKQRRVMYRKLLLLSEMEVKTALRKKISLHQSVVDEVYKYTGRFPHLIHLYDRWEPRTHSIEEQSSVITQTFSDKIFEYFRDLSLDARLLIATCLHENLVSEKISYTTFYEKFPFLSISLPKDQLVHAIKEINDYGSGLSAKAEAETFQISLSDNAQLFYEASKHISWIKDFKTLYDFTYLPVQEKAHNVALTFIRITQSALDSYESLNQKTKKYKDKFYVTKLTEQGLQALKIPLTTFVVISLTPWRKETHMDAFQDLSIEFQEFNRKTGELQIFYILLFELHRTPKEEVKKGLEGLERISIIDATMMKDIIMAESPQEKATGYIFGQLSIKERSPYTTAGAVPDSLFFGRQMEIALIRGLPENIGIFGTRTIGKTSLLRKLHRAFKSQQQWKVYDLDCARIESEESLLQNLAEKMGIPFEQISNMDKFRRYVTKEAEAGGHRYLFLLDEVDRLAQYDIEHDEKIFNTFNRLCNEIMKNNETAARFILFGFQQMFEQMKNPLSRLYNFMVFMPLKPLDMEGAMSLVTRPIENIRVRWNNREDANYLVDNCSRHPRLLQAACHALLTNLDDKEMKRDVIERTDVDKALTSDEFREICMRFYHEHVREKGNGDENNEKEKKKIEKKKPFFARIRGKDTIQTPDIDAQETIDENTTKNRKEFLGDLHRITILAAVHLLFEEGKESFAIMDIQKELKSYSIDVSPNIMRNILDQLCLSGNFRLQDESTIISTRELKAAEKIDIDLAVDHPNVYGGSDAAIPRFTYEFGVKIFPKLLVAHFGGMKQCEEERKKLIEKGDWQEWLRRY
jgi:Ni2+-binding GTPase involved in maturation of urease and hydrogenase